MKNIFFFLLIALILTSCKDDLDEAFKSHSCAFECAQKAYHSGDMSKFDEYKKIQFHWSRIYDSIWDERFGPDKGKENTDCDCN